LLAPGPARPRLAIVLKGYPRLSETFIAQEILALEQRGFPIEIWSLRRPTDRLRHPMHNAIRANLHYLPEYLHRGPIRVLLGLLCALARPEFSALIRVFLRDFRRDFTVNRVRRLGQALVLARELDPSIRHIHVHFLHTPGSVVRYATLLSRRTFSFSAHAKDIWTIPDWERAEKIVAAQWGVACTRDGVSELRRVAGEAGARVELLYHGLDLARFPAPPAAREPRDGSDPDRPVRIVTVGRAVDKKGFDDLLDALSQLPSTLHWRLSHAGSGPLLPALKSQAERLGLAARVTWLGGQAQSDVIAILREADLFALPSKPGAGGDRDGLPNVLMEAATQGLPLVSTRFAGVPEFVTDGQNGLLVPPADPAALATAIERLIVDPSLRQRLGEAAYARVRNDFSFESGIDRLVNLLDTSRMRVES
jgi:glycosyltransferase involved in cell wall biosynthesis